MPMTTSCRAVIKRRVFLKQLRQRTLPGLFLFLGSAFGPQAVAEPYTPTSDDQVLQRLPTPAALQGTDRLQQTLSASPRDRDTAERLARLYIQAGQSEGDPRYLGYARATLAPWLESGDPPASMLVLAATIAQGEHRFTEARHRLRQALEKNPRLGQGWLTLAVVNQVQGRYDDGLTACANATNLVTAAAALTCQAGLRALSGDLNPAYEKLNRYAAVAGRLAEPVPDDVAAWMYTRLAEMAWQKGQPQTALKHVRAGRRIAPEDRYLRHVHADLLIGQERYREAIALLEDYTDQDGALLRLALAGQAVKDDRATDWAQRFRDRMAAAQRGGELTHLREFARFTLAVDEDAEQALSMSQQNWRNQKEPADMLVYLRAAEAAGNPRAADEVHAFIAEHRLQDARLQRFLNDREGDTP